MSVKAARWRQIGTNVDVLAANGWIAHARTAVEETIAAADLSFSRFRPDSELSQLNAAAGRRMPAGALLAVAIETALEAARRTDGVVDPSVGRVVRMAGYDRDFALLRDAGAPDEPWQFTSLPGWRAIELDAEHSSVRVPRGVELDLDATGKALIVDMALRAAAATQPADAGLLVSIGGDMAVWGRPPRGGWRVRLAEDSSLPPSGAGPSVSIRSGALATSSTTVRRWRRGSETVHHLIDPRTGRPTCGPWRTASVVADSCVDANTAATAAIVLGPEAPAWLAERGIPARLVSDDGSVEFVGGWPSDVQARRAA